MRNSPHVPARTAPEIRGFQVTASWFKTLAVLALLAGTEPSLAGSAADDDTLTRLHARDVAVQATGYRLASANASLCRDKAAVSGLSIHTLEQYGPGYRAAAASLFGLGSEPAILAVAPGSPAADAGLEEGDALVEVAGSRLPDAEPAAGADYTRTAKVQAMLDAAFAAGPAQLTLRRQGRLVVANVRPVESCRSRFEVAPGRRLNGAADGTTVQISEGLAGLAASPDELAAPLAHELAHNILAHRARLDADHVDRGLLAVFGRNARLIRRTEAEADRLSLYLMDRAGFDPAAALAFWTRVARSDPGSDLDPTHPRWRERLAALKAEAALISAARTAGRTPELPPDLKMQIETASSP